MPLELRRDIGALRLDPEAKLTRISDQRLDQFERHPAPADFGRDKRVFGNAYSAAQDPGQPPDRFRAGNMGMVFAALIIAMTGYVDWLHGGLLA